MVSIHQEKNLPEHTVNLFARMWSSHERQTGPKTSSFASQDPAMYFPSEEQRKLHTVRPVNSHSGVFNTSPPESRLRRRRFLLFSRQSIVPKGCSGETGETLVVLFSSRWRPSDEKPMGNQKSCQMTNSLADPGAMPATWLQPRKPRVNGGDCCCCCCQTPPK